MSGTESSEIIDVRPLRVSSTNSGWDRAVALRDQYAKRIRLALVRSKTDAIVLVSHPGVYPPWVRLDAWMPVSGRPNGPRSRRNLELTVNALPYNHHNLAVTVNATREHKKISIAGRPTSEFGYPDVDEWFGYAMRNAPKPSSYQPWRDLFIGFVSGVIPIIEAPHHNPIDDRFRNVFGLTGANCLGFVSIFVVLFGAAAMENDGPFALLPGIAGLAATAFIVHQRTRRIAVPDQPTIAPNNLVLVDSWHTVISGLGADANEVKQRVWHAVGSDGASGIKLARHTYTYWTPTGYEQRDRIVADKGQTIVHTHVYPFGGDLFVGWQAYLNCAQWGETGAVSKLVANGVLTEFRDLRPVFYSPNPLDLIDLSSLGELVHRHLTREIKALLTERAIDDDVDFEIVRGDRGRALDRTRQGDKTQIGGGAWSRIARQAALWQRRGETETVRAVSHAQGPYLTGQTGPVLLLTALLLAVSYVNRVNVGFAALTINRALGLSPAEYGLAASALGWGLVLGVIPANAILYRIGARKWIGFIAVTWGLISASQAFMTGPTSFMVLRFLLGATQAGLLPGVIFYLLTSFAPANRARLIAGFLVGLPAGLAAAPAVTSWLLLTIAPADLASWQWMLIVEALPAVLLGFAAWQWLPDEPYRRVGGEISVVGTAFGLLLNGRVLALSVGYLGITVTSFATSFFLADLAQHAGIGIRDIGEHLSISYAAGGAVMLVSAYIADTMRGYRGNLVLACAAAALGCVVLAQANDLAGLLLGIGLITAGTYAARTQLLALSAEAFGGARLAAAVAVLISIGNAAGISAPPVIVWLRQNSDFETSMYALAAACFMGGVLAVIAFAVGGRH